MTNFTMNCIFNANSTDANGTYVGSFNANYDNGNIYYNMNVMDALANQEEVAKDFDAFKTEVFSKIAALTSAGFITEPVREEPMPIEPIPAEEPVEESPEATPAE